MWKTSLIVLLILFSLPYSGKAQKKALRPIDTTWYTPGDVDYNLLVAAYLGYERDIVRFLRQGAYVNTMTMNGNTPLHLAAQEGHLKVVEQLLLHGATVDEEDKEGMTPLMKAVQQGHGDVAAYLLAHGADAEARDHHGRTPLLLAAAYGSPSLVQLLLDHGASPEARDKLGNTPLLAAVYAGRRGTVQLLLSRGADVNARDRRGFTPLLTAVQRGDTAMVHLLLQHGADLYATTASGYPALALAVQEGDTAMARLLLSADTAGRFREESGPNALTLALTHHDEAMKELLIDHDYPLRQRPYLDHLSLGGEMLLNGPDFMPGLFVALTEGRTALSLDAGFLYRALPARVLIPAGEHRFYQFREYRGLLYAGIGKAFLFGRRRDGRHHLGADLLLHGAWSFGPAYAGSRRQPASLLTLTPSAGLFFRTGGFEVRAGYTWLDLDTYDLSPHHFNLRIAWVLNRQRFTRTRKEIPWFDKNTTP